MKPMTVSVVASLAIHTVERMPTLAVGAVEVRLSRSGQQLEGPCGCWQRRPPSFVASACEPANDQTARYYSPSRHLASNYPSDLGGDLMTWSASGMTSQASTSHR